MITAAMAATSNAMTTRRTVGILLPLSPPAVGVLLDEEEALELTELLDETAGLLLDEEEEETEDDEDVVLSEEELLDEAALTGRKVTVRECGPDTFSNV